MKIDLNNHKNLCKDSRQKIIVSRDDKEKSVGKKCEHKATNKNLSLVRHFKVDGDILIDGKKCDFLLLNDNKKEAYLIELKRSKLLEASQLPATKVASLGSETPNCLDTADLLTAETISRGLLITKAIIVRKLSNGLHSSE